MSSSFVSRWVVARTYHHDAGAGDLPDHMIEQWIAEVRDAYLAQCPVLQATIERAGLELRARTGDLPTGAFFGRPDTVVVSAGVTEVHPTSFTMALRLRSVGKGEEDVAANVACVVTLEDPDSGEPAGIDDSIRDEMIALEHAARHYN